MMPDPSSEQPSEQSSPPERLGRYRLVRCISTGGMARVYEARRESLAGVSPKVAIKVILPEHATDEKFQQLFVNEARIGSQLQHQNLVQIQDFDREGEHYYLVMEYVEGLTLRRVITLCKRSGVHVPLAVIAELGRHICEGLHYAHTARREDGEPLKLVHRDIKPSNLIVNPQGVTKILDFGISKALSSLESKGAVKGTWGYMSPEQAEGKDVSAAADQYGVAAVLYELALSRPLFPEKDPRELRQLMAQDEGARRASRLGGTYAPLHYPLVRALQREPSARWVNCLVMAQELARLVPDQVVARQQLLSFINHIRALDEARRANSPELVAAATNRLIAAGYSNDNSGEVAEEWPSNVSDVSQPQRGEESSPMGSGDYGGYYAGGAHALAPAEPVPGPATMGSARSLGAISPADQSPYLSGMPVTVGDAWRPRAPEHTRPVAPEAEPARPSLFGVLLVGVALCVFAYVGYRVLSKPAETAPPPPVDVAVAQPVVVEPAVVEVPPPQPNPPRVKVEAPTPDPVIDPPPVEEPKPPREGGDRGGSRGEERPPDEPVPEETPASDPAGVGKLRIRAKEAGTLSLDDVEVYTGDAPIVFQDVPAGKHRITFRPEKGGSSGGPAQVVADQKTCIFCDPDNCRVESPCD